MTQNFYNLTNKLLSENKKLQLPLFTVGTKMSAKGHFFTPAPGWPPIYLHPEGSNNMRWVLVAISAIFSTFRNFRQNIGKTPSESFAGRQICIFASIQFTDTVQNETNFYIQWKYFKPVSVFVQNSVSKYKSI